MEQKEKIRIQPEALPTPKLVGKLRRQKRKNRYKALELGNVMSRVEQLEHDKKAVSEYDIDRGRFVKKPKPAVTVDSYKTWAAKWFTARLAYAFGLVLPWEVTEHGRRFKRGAAAVWPGTREGAGSGQEREALLLSLLRDMRRDAGGNM